MEYCISREDPDKARSEIFSTLRESFPHLLASRIDWIYLANPAGPALVWLARVGEGGEAVGSAAVLPRKFVVDGRQHVAGISADFSVSAAYRGFGPALALQRSMVAVVGQETSFIYGQPTRQAAPVLRRAGYRTIGSISEWTRPLRTKQLLERRTGSRGLASLLSPFADGLLAAHARAKSLTLGRDRTLHSRELTDFDERFDALWASAQALHRVVGERSASFLRWRFEASPQAAYRIFGLVGGKSDRLAAYIVFRSLDGRTVIDDLLSQDLDTTLDTLLREFVAFRQREKSQAIVVHFFGSSRLARALRRNAFVMRGEVLPLVLYVPAESPIAAAVSEPENWWLFRSDNDV